MISFCTRYFKTTRRTLELHQQALIQLNESAPSSTLQSIVHDELGYLKIKQELLTLFGSVTISTNLFASFH